MSVIKPVPGICDRCGQRFRLQQLKPEHVLGLNTGLLVCQKCIDPSHPQLDTRGIRTDDRQSVPDSRSDSAELAASRALFGFNPVGAELTSTAIVSIGRVRVEIT
jgi:hypothetical protein